MSKPDYVRVHEWATGEDADPLEGEPGYWKVHAESDPRWLADVLNGLREKDFGVWIFKSGIIIHQFNPDRGGAVGEGTTINEALLAACLKYIARAT